MNEALIIKIQVITAPQKPGVVYGRHSNVATRILEVLPRLLNFCFVTTDSSRCCFTKNHYSLHPSRHTGRDNFETIFSLASGYEDCAVQQEVEKVFLRGEIIANGTH